MQTIRRTTAGVIALVILATANVAAEEPNRWTASIERFEAADANAMPRKDAALFVGSSSIVFWANLADDMTPLPVINRGFGGSTMQDLNYHRERVVKPYEPSLVLVYEGDNDLAFGRDRETILDDFKDFVRYVDHALPDTDICFIAIKPSLSREHLWATADAINGDLEAWATTRDDLCFIDVASPMLMDDGKADPSLFVADGLHMNKKGYAIWARVVRPVVEARLSQP